MTNKERLATIEAYQVDMKDDLSYIKFNMVDRGTVNILKWATGIIGSIAVTSLIMAAKLG